MSPATIRFLINKGIDLFCVVNCFQHFTGHMTMGSFVLYYKKSGSGPLLCNIGSGIAHHCVYYASVVTPSNGPEENKYNIYV